MSQSLVNFIVKRGDLAGIVKYHKVFVHKKKITILSSFQNIDPCTPVTSRVKLGLIQPAKVTVLEQRVVEKWQFTMADLLPTEVPCQFGVKPARKCRLVLVI